MKSKLLIAPKVTRKQEGNFPKGNPESKVTRKQEGNFPKGNPEPRKIQNGQYVSSQQRQIDNLRDCMARLRAVGIVPRRAQTTSNITRHGSNMNKNADVKSQQLINY